MKACLSRRSQTWSGIIAVVVVALVLAFVKAGDRAATGLAVDDSYDGKEVRMATGGSLQIALNSNPTTGFKWELTGISDPTVLEKVSDVYEASQSKPKEGAPPRVGAGGREFWSFKALKRGAAIISMEYSRPWQGGEKGARKFSLTAVAE
ncbi:MAG: protease inhibitor I42 family protein [Chloroflexi bacterium]|nr:protease inhibitor I42 family protein [Chloroflexota bacterium]